MLQLPNPTPNTLPPPTAPARRGFPLLRREPVDPVERTMRELAHQGTGMARLAHFFATVMVVLFSLGSLVALSGESFSAIVATVEHGGIPSIPQAISIAVSTLMVVCCDIGLVYAAMTLRVLKTRGADEGATLHWIVLVGVSLIEGGTYLYMSWLYEHPSGFAWALVVARALAAPLLSVYLSMARAHPVTPRDILHQAELAQGIQLVRDVIQVAQDPAASLADKMRLYEASAEMSERDKTRLNGMIGVVKSRLGAGSRSETGEPAQLAAVVAARALELVAPSLQGSEPAERAASANVEPDADATLVELEPDAGDEGGDDEDGDEDGDELEPLAGMPTTRYSARRLAERLSAARR